MSSLGCAPRYLDGVFGQLVRPLDLSDDRLANILDRLADAATWAELETALNGTCCGLMRWAATGVRLDSTSAKTYAGVSEGLFQFGHSQDHRPDLPQVKISLGASSRSGLAVDDHRGEWERRG